MITFTAFFRVKLGYITIKIPEGYQGSIDLIGEKCKTGQMTVSLSKPRKPRTTGEGSQNSHSWGHMAQIARETGHEVYEIEYLTKFRAIKRGYPVNTCLGITVPKSQSEIDTVENGYLIDELHQVAAENGITLIEGVEDGNAN